MTSKTMNPSQNPAQDKLQAKIHSWLAEEGWKTGKFDWTGLSWALKAESDVGFAMVVTQRTNRPDQILIQMNINVSENHRGQLARLPQSERTSLVWELRLALAPLDVSFTGIQDPLRDICHHSKHI
jgi:hypothetical protein